MWHQIQYCGQGFGFSIAAIGMRWLKCAHLNIGRQISFDGNCKTLPSLYHLGFRVPMTGRFPCPYLILLRPCFLVNKLSKPIALWAGWCMSLGALWWPAHSILSNLAIPFLFKDPFLLPRYVLLRRGMQYERTHILLMMYLDRIQRFLVDASAIELCSFAASISYWTCALFGKDQ